MGKTLNLNDNPEKLKEEEQAILDDLIQRMNNVLKKENTNEDRKRILQIRDELYEYRLLLKFDDDEGAGIREFKVGLHKTNYSNYSDEIFVRSWLEPPFRSFVMNKELVHHNIVKDNHGEEYHTDYKLLVKNKIELRFM